MFIFAIYLIVVGGIGFAFYPHLTLSFVGLTTNDETFTRLFGLLAAILGCNYLLMIQQSAIRSFQLSVIMRYLAALFMIYLVIQRISHHNLLLFALGDLVAATWTLVALYYDNRSIIHHNKQSNKTH